MNTKVKRCQIEYSTTGRNAEEVAKITADFIRASGVINPMILVKPKDTPWYVWRAWFDVVVEFDKAGGTPAGLPDVVKCDDCGKEINEHNVRAGHDRLERAGYLRRYREGNIPGLFPRRCSRCTSERLERPPGQYHGE